MADPPKTVAELDDRQRGIDHRGIETPPRIPQTTTPMTTAAPPLEERPLPAPKYRLITKRIDAFWLHGSKLDAAREISAASEIWSQCGIVFEIVSTTNYDADQTRRLLAVTEPVGGTPAQEPTVIVDPDSTTPSMENLRREWRSKRRGDYAVFFAPKVFLIPSAAPSAADPDLDMVYIGENKHGFWPGWVVAHELGHRLIDPTATHAVLQSPLMKPEHPGNDIVELECRAARGDAKARFEITRRSQR